MNASLFIVNRDSKKGFNNLSKTSGQARKEIPFILKRVQDYMVINLTTFRNHVFIDDIQLCMPNFFQQPFSKRPPNCV